MRAALLTVLLLLSGDDLRAEKVTPLQQQTLPDLTGKEGLLIQVEIAPNEIVPKHRHDADVFAYVLSGTIETHVQGQPVKIVHAGQSFLEGPHDIHLDSRNPSSTEPARLLVFFVKAQGAPPTIYLGARSAKH